MRKLDVRRWGAVAVVGLLVALSREATGAPAPCVILEGIGIGGVRVGMDVPAALAVTGPPLAQQASGSEVVYTLPAPWSYLVADYGVVQRIGTRAPACQTAGGAGMGTTLSALRLIYASATASMIVPILEGDLLTYPFVGIRFVLRRDRVEVVEVFRPELAARAPVTRPVASPDTAQGTPGSPAPSPTPVPSPWSVRISSALVQETTFVVTGTVGNRSRTQSVYAEVRAFSGAARLVSQSDAPVTPNPVPSGGSASFEVRLIIDDVVRRYTVTIRPIGSITASLVEHTGEIKDFQQFASVVARQVQAVVLTIANPPTGNDFIVEVTNGSSLPLGSVTVGVEITGACRVIRPAPLSRTVQELRYGSVVLQQIRPGGAARAALPLQAGICSAFDTWSAKPRVGEIRVGE